MALVGTRYKKCSIEKRDVESRGCWKLDNIIMTILGFVVPMISVVAVVVKLNSTITKLNVTMQVLNEQMKGSQKDREKIHTQLNDHETRITVLESERK